MPSDPLPVDHTQAFEEESRYLRAGYFDAVIFLAGMIGIVAFMRAAAWREAPGIFHTWPVPLALGVGLALAHNYKARFPVFSRWAFAGALLTANLIEAIYFPAGPAVFLFSAIVVIAGLLMTEREALLALGLTIALIVVAAWRLQPAIPAQHALWSVCIVALIGFASYLGTRQLYTVLRWEWGSTQEAIRATREAQDHRAELMLLNKELEGAYLRLDRVNRMLVLARQEVEQASALKMQFANAVSHELRSPLNMIIGFSEMMVNSPELYGPQAWPPRLKHHVQQIYNSSRHLSQLIDDVLDMARINADRLALVKEPVDLRGIAEEAAAIVHDLYEARRLSLRIDIPDALPQVMADRTRIRQVLLNLLTNAVRFTEQGGVVMRAEQVADELAIRVTDSGAGIPPEDLPRLFQEFRQLDGSFYRWQRGSGLGLAISRQLVELHSGRIWADSAPDQGSTFSFTLPLAPRYASPPAHADAAEQFWGYLEQKARERKPVVALAASPAAQRLLATRLSSCDIVWASGIDDIPRAIDEARPLALVAASDRADLLTDAARLLPQLDEVPLIACALPGLASPALPSAIDDYIVKPVSRQRLAESVRRLSQPPSACLIVEDDPAMQEFLGLAMLSACPACGVHKAATAEGALRMLDAIRPDLVLLDLNLPDADGLQLAADLRARHARLPIIIITARDAPAGDEPDEPDAFYCARRGRFTPREIERLLNGALDALSAAPSPSPEPR
jgi:signal transduction histidine kinase/CheY-like chemotaxis protein